MESCKACYFWDAQDQSGDMDLVRGICRRRAPLGKITFILNEGSRQRMEMSVHESCWPPTQGDDCCGEWEPRVTANGPIVNRQSTIDNGAKR